MSLIDNGNKYKNLLEEINLKYIENYDYVKIINRVEESKNKQKLDKNKNMLKNAEIYDLSYNKQNSLINERNDNYLTNEIMITYKIDEKEDRLRLFGKEFFEKNKNKCKIIINNEIK